MCLSVTITAPIFPFFTMECPSSYLLPGFESYPLTAAQGAELSIIYSLFVFWYFHFSLV